MNGHNQKPWRGVLHREYAVSPVTFPALRCSRLLTVSRLQDPNLWPLAEFLVSELVLVNCHLQLKQVYGKAVTPVAMRPVRSLFQCLCFALKIRTHSGWRALGYHSAVPLLSSESFASQRAPKAVGVLCTVFMSDRRAAIFLTHALHSNTLSTGEISAHIPGLRPCLLFPVLPLTLVFLCISLRYSSLPSYFVTTFVFVAVPLTQSYHREEDVSFYLPSLSQVPFTHMIESQ